MDLKNFHVRLNPTRGEALYIRRMRKSLTQIEAAKGMRVSIETYRAWEKETLDTAPIIQVRPIKPREACVIFRRRSKKTQAQIAKEIGISRVLVVRMENGLCDLRHLATYWGIR